MAFFLCADPVAGVGPSSPSAGVLQGFKLGHGRRTAKAVWQAYRNGRRAAWLPGQDFVTLLDEPLEAARARLNIARPTEYLAVPEQWRDGVLSAPVMA